MYFHQRQLLLSFFICLFVRSLAVLLQNYTYPNFQKFRWKDGILAVEEAIRF